MSARFLHAIAAAAAMLAALSGCAPPAAPNVVQPTPTPTGSAFALLTHCGIREARVKDTFYVADVPLDDGNGNPPAGWDNPYQQGTITVDGRKAVFRDTSGHTVTFTERPGATSFLRICS